jgi:hypothetical protein
MSFSKNGYYIIENFLNHDFLKFIEQYFYTRIKSGFNVTYGDDQAPGSCSFYGDPLIDTILENSKEHLSKVTNKILLPTYSYTRFYGKDDELIIHRDRPSCEISATLSLAIPNGEEISPIYFSENEDKSNAAEILLKPGDLCLYRGCDLYHWREPFTQRWYLQSFLHYVDAEGPHAKNIYDGRPYLGCPPKKD